MIIRTRRTITSLQSDKKRSLSFYQAHVTFACKLYKSTELPSLNDQHTQKKQPAAMVIIKSKFPFALLFSFLFTLLISSSYEIPAGQKTAVDRCIDRCRETEEELSGLFSCSARCERRYSEWEPESSPRELEQCQQRCLADERADRKQQQQQCQKHCKEQQAIREREEERHREQRERDWEREREQFEDINSVPPDPEEEYKQFKQLCEKQEAGQKRQCERRCERHC